MFSGVWTFIGGLLLVLVFSSICEFVFEKTLSFLQIVIRGYPQNITNNYIKKEEDKNEQTE